MAKNTKEKFNLKWKLQKLSVPSILYLKAPPCLQIMALFLMVQENKNIIFLAFCLQSHSSYFMQLATNSFNNEIINKYPNQFVMNFFQPRLV